MVAVRTDGMHPLMVNILVTASSTANFPTPTGRSARNTVVGMASSVVNALRTLVLVPGMYSNRLHPVPTGIKSHRRFLYNRVSVRITAFTVAGTRIIH